MSYPDAVREYLRFVLNQLRVSPSALAKRAGVASTTLTRFLNNSDHQFALSMTTLDKIAKISGFSPAPFFEGGKAIELRSVIAGSSRVTSNATTIVEYEAAVGVWKDSSIFENYPFEAAVELPPPIPGGGHFYCSVADSAIDRIAEKGDYIFCKRINSVDDIPFNRQNGALLIIERRSPDGETVETTARLLDTEGGTPVLRLASKSKRFANERTLPLDKARDVHVAGFALCVVTALRFSKTVQ